MKYCKKCLTTNLRPNAHFDEEGVCIACRYTDEDLSKSSTSKLNALVNKIKDAQKGKKKTDYDCIVGVSGGKDSTRQAHWVRDRLGLRPLLVCAAYPPKQMSEIGAENLSNLIKMGFDLHVVTPAPQTSARLTLESFKRFGNVNKSTEMALFSTVPRLAIDFGVRLIFWGENPALQVGDSSVLGVDEFDGNNLRKLNTLTEGGYWITDILNASYKANHYIYPTEELFLKKKIQIFYLGAAWDDWSTKNNAEYAALNGLTLRPGEETKTGDISNASMLDEEFTNINMMLKYFKFGFGRTTDQVCELIRNRKITREDAIKIVEEYDGVCSDEIITSFCNYVDISVNQFWNITNNFVNKNLFEITSGERPVKKFIVGVDYEC